MANIMGRRMFHATRARLSSPYHYPEGPYSNLPFNTKTRFFAVRYWLYCITGFFAPFGIAGASFPRPSGLGAAYTVSVLIGLYSLANLQAQGLSVSPEYTIHGGLPRLGRDRQGNATDDFGSCKYMRTLEFEANCRHTFPYVSFQQILTKQKHG
jgi:cytochrome c oxidase subunit 7c